jgi:AcrR family transcriptional regulator
MARPRKDEGRDTRRDILDRSLELFAAHGFTGSSMRDIAKAVGVRESALYHHFPNKNAILTAVLEESGPGALNSLVTADVVQMVEAVGVREFLGTIAETLVTLWSTPRERHLLRILMAEWPRLKEASLVDPPQAMMKVRLRLGQLFTQLGDRGLIRPIDPLTTTLRFMGPFMFARLLHLADLSRPPDVKAAREDLTRHLDSFWASIQPEPASVKRVGRR